jgi:hypothetical protein
MGDTYQGLCGEKAIRTTKKYKEDKQIMMIHGRKKIATKMVVKKQPKNTFTTKDKLLALHERDEVNRFFLIKCEQRFFIYFIGLDKTLGAMECLGVTGFGVSPMCVPPRHAGPGTGSRRTANQLRPASCLCRRTSGVGQAIHV